MLRCCVYTDRKNAVVKDKEVKEKMRKCKKWVSLFMGCLLMCSSLFMNVSAAEEIPYDAVIDAYLNGNVMADWVVSARKHAAEKLGLSAYLDDRSFLSLEYRNEHKIGRSEAISDPNLNILVEMATVEEEEMILMAGMIQTFNMTRSISSGDTVSVTQKARVSGAGNGYFTVDGADSYGYCAQNSKDFWYNNQVKTGPAKEWDNANARKVLYYGPGGPGYSGPYYGSLGADMDYTTFAVGKLNGDTANNTKSTAYINKVSGYTDPIVYGYKAYIADIANPYQDVAFLSKSSVLVDLTITKRSADDLNSGKSTYLTGAEFEIYAWTGNAYTKFVTKSIDNGDGTYTFKGIDRSLSSDATFLVKEIKAPSGYTLGYYTNSEKDKSDLTNWGGRQFLLQEDGSWTCYSLKDHTNQSIGFTFYDYPNGKLSLLKSSSSPGITDGNDCYSLSGAVYKVYSDVDLKHEVGTFTTDATGKSNEIILAPGTYYVKESVAPKGYALDTTSHKVVLDKGGSQVLKVTDLPQLDPVGILLGKIDAQTTQGLPQGSLSFKGAQFTVKYYDVLLADKNADPASKGHSPVKTWVFETDADGFCEYQTEYLVSGDDLYISPSGEPSLPGGTITIQETLPPEGYLLNPEVFVRQITFEGNTESVFTYNHPIVPENILQLDLTKLQEGTANAIKGAKFEHVLPNGSKEVLETDANGKITLKGLQRGKHSLREVAAPEGFMINTNTVTFTVEKNNTVTLNSDVASFGGSILFETTSSGNIKMTVYDKLGKFSIVVNKENNEGLKLPGAEFALYEDKECTKKVASGVTNDKGILEFTKLNIAKKYYLREEKAPAGYRKNSDILGKSIVTEVQLTVTETGAFKFFIDGKEYDKSSTGLYTLTGDTENKAVNVTVVNQIQLRLPETGSILMIPMSASGIGGVALGGILRRKKDDDQLI